MHNISLRILVAEFFTVHKLAAPLPMSEVYQTGMVTPKGAKHNAWHQELVLHQQC